MFKTVIVFWFSLWATTAFAQEKLILQGRVVTDTIENFQTNIINKTEQGGTVTQPDGRFRVEVNLGDELTFSAVGYRDYDLVVTQQLVQNDSLVIRLKPSFTILNTVHLSNRDLTGDLHKDVDKLYTFDQTQLSLPGVVPKDRTIAQRRYDLATKSFGGGVPVEALINLISGQTKKLKRQLKNSKKEQLKDKALYLLTEDFFVKSLGLPKSKVQNFLYFCLDDDQFEVAVRSGPFGLIAFFQSKIKLYKERADL